MLWPQTMWWPKMYFPSDIVHKTEKFMRIYRRCSKHRQCHLLPRPRSVEGIKQALFPSVSVRVRSSRRFWLWFNTFVSLQWCLETTAALLAAQTCTKTLQEHTSISFQCCLMSKNDGGIGWRLFDAEGNFVYCSVSDYCVLFFFFSYVTAPSVSASTFKLCRLVYSRVEIIHIKLLFLMRRDAPLWNRMMGNAKPENTERNCEDLIPHASNKRLQVKKQVTAPSKKHHAIFHALHRIGCCFTYQWHWNETCHIEFLVYARLSFLHIDCPTRHLWPLNLLQGIQHDIAVMENAWLWSPCVCH